jgi:hypothetical protein
MIGVVGMLIFILLDLLSVGLKVNAAPVNPMTAFAEISSTPGNNATGCTSHTTEAWNTHNHPRHAY